MGSLGSTALDCFLLISPGALKHSLNPSEIAARHPTHPPNPTPACTHCKTLDPELINYHPVVGLNVGHPEFKEVRLSE